MVHDDLSQELTMRISSADRDQLDGIAGRLPLKTRTIARIALRLGMAAIEKDPARIFVAVAGRKAAPSHTRKKN